MQNEICRFGMGTKVAVISQPGEFTRRCAYRVDIGDLVRRAAAHADLILRGRKPAETPIQLPTKFELFVNLDRSR